MTTTENSLDVSELPVVAFGPHSSIWWGQFWMAMVEGVVFLLLFAFYFYARLRFDVWPPPGADEPSLWLPSINVFILIASLIPMEIGDKAIVKNDWHTAIRGLFTNIALGVVYLIIQIIILSQVQFKWSSHLYGSLFWTLMLLHTSHTIFSLLESTVIGLYALRGMRKEKLRQALNVDEIYWFLVAGVGILMYLILFLTPHLT